MRQIDAAVRRPVRCFVLLIIGVVLISAAFLVRSAIRKPQPLELSSSERNQSTRKVSSPSTSGLISSKAPSSSATEGQAARGFHGINGVLRRSKVNPRYFTDSSGRAVYLTGSHTWYVFQDEAGAEPIDYARWLDSLAANNHNFMRLWNEEVWIKGPSTPSPYRRTGPGLANDGRPKYDLDDFNEAYFDRLRERIISAGQRGIYVAFCLFNGWAVRDNGEGNPWPHHFFHRGNNVNGIDGDANNNGQGEEVVTLRVDSRVAEYQKAFVRKVVDTLNDLDNVLWEIANETQRESVGWQYMMINFLRSYAGVKSKRHPIGMSSPAFGTSNETVFKSPADWVAPAANRFDDVDDQWSSDMPPPYGSKVVVLDTDHIGFKMFMGEGAFQRTFAWKAFTRGMNPILMEDYRRDFEAVRKTMGQTRRFADRMNLTYMAPRGDLTSTRFALANTGHEYLILQPTSGSFTVDLAHTSRSFAAEWFAPATGQSMMGTPLRGGSVVTVTPPFAGPAVVYLRGR